MCVCEPQDALAVHLTFVSVTEAELKMMQKITVYLIKHVDLSKPYIKGGGNNGGRGGGGGRERKK